MTKQGEIDYVKNIGNEGMLHALNKPFSDSECGFYLIDIGIIIGLLPEPLAKLLDLGVGTGWTSAFFAKRGYEVLGQDICPDMISLANKNKDRYQALSTSFIISDYENLEFSEEFDCAVFYDSLHHAENEHLALEKVYKALKPGGVLITAEPGKGHSKSLDGKKAMLKYGVTEKAD